MLGFFKNKSKEAWWTDMAKKNDRKEYNKLKKKKADRCEHTMEICIKSFPESYEIDGHKVNCHLYGGENGWDFKNRKC